MRTKDPTSYATTHALSLECPQYDPQRGKVYRMEKEWLGFSLLSDTDPAYLVYLGHELCKLYHVEDPGLEIIDSAEHADTWAEYDGHDECIRLYHPHGANIASFLHELAHHITNVLYDDMGHGPIFVSVLKYLLYKSRCVSREAFNLAANKWGVEQHYEERPSALYRRRTNADL